MLTDFKFTLAATALVCLAGSFDANATTIDFSTALPLGHQGQSITVSGITISAWIVGKVGGTWVSDGVILNNRRELPNELGLGVCLSSNCPTTGNGSINEIDNNGSTFDVIRLDFGAPTLVSSFGLSSLDSGIKDGFAIFGGNAAQPDLRPTMLLPAMQQGTNATVGQVDPIISINQVDRYFFVTSLNRSTSDTGSDFLLASVNTTPEPFTAGTLGLGLLAIGAVLRLKTRRQA